MNEAHLYSLLEWMLNHETTCARKYHLAINRTLPTEYITQMLEAILKSFPSCVQPKRHQDELCLSVTNNQPIIEFIAKSGLQNKLTVLTDIVTPSITGNNNIINVAQGSITLNEVAINAMANNAHVKVENHTLDVPIINIGESLKKYHLPNYHYWSISIKMNGKKISTQSIYSKLNEYINNDFKRQILSIASSSNRISASSNEIIYKQNLQEDRIVNHVREVGMKLSQNTIHFEFAQYKSGADLLTDMSQDFMPSLVLLFFTKTLFNSEIDVEVSVSISTNWKLIFMPTPGNPFSVKRSNTSTYQLNPNNRTFSTKITDFENSTLMDFMEEVVEGFAADSPFSNTLFLSVDVPEQELMLNHVKQYL